MDNNNNTYNNNSALGNSYQNFSNQEDVNRIDLNTAANNSRNHKLKIIVYISLAILINIIVLMYINGQHIYKTEGPDIVKTDTVTK